MARLSKKANVPSTPYASFAPPPLWPTDRPVKRTPTLLRRRMSRLSRTTEKFVAARPTRGSSSVWMFKHAEAVAADPAGQAAAGVDRHRAAVVRGRSAGCRRGSACRSPPAICPGRRPAEGERALVLEKELALLGKEQAEAREVDLLLVGLDLREVGVVGEVGRQVLRDAVLHVERRRRRPDRSRSRAWRCDRSSGPRSTYGLISRFFEPAGASRPTSVAASDTWIAPRCPSAAGMRVRYEISFFHRLSRRR